MKIEIHEDLSSPLCTRDQRVASDMTHNIMRVSLGGLLQFKIQLLFPSHFLYAGQMEMYLCVSVLKKKEISRSSVEKQVFEIHFIISPSLK